MKQSALILVIAICGFAMPCPAAERPRIQVAFRIELDAWREKLERDIADIKSRVSDFDGSIDDLETGIAVTLADMFIRKFQCFDFSTGETTIRLNVGVVARPVNPEISYVPTDFRLEVVGLPPAYGKPVTKLVFRQGVESRMSVSYQGLAEETRLRMEARLDTASDRIVAELLAHISLADQICLIGDPSRAIGVLPWSRDDLQVPNHAEFIIRTKRPVLQITREHFTWVVGAASELPESLRNQLPDAFLEGLLVEDHPPANTSGHVPLGQIVSSFPSTADVQGLHLMRYTPGSQSGSLNHTPTRGFD